MKTVVSTLFVTLAIMSMGGVLPSTTVYAQARSNTSSSGARTSAGHAPRSNSPSIRAPGNTAPRNHAVVPGRNWRGAHPGVRPNYPAPRQGYYYGPRARVFLPAPYVMSPLWDSYGYYDGAYVPPPDEPLVYMEQAPDGSPQVAQSQPQQYWYYCRDSNVYYPYAQSCNGAWEQVVPYSVQ